MTAHVEYIVNATHYPKKSVLVSARAVASEIDAIYLRPVLLSIALVVAPYGSEHRRPWALDDKIAAFMRAYGLPCARHHVHLDSGQRLRGRAGLSRRRTREWADHYRARFRLPPCINNRAATFPDYLPIPHPRFGVDGFTYRA